MKRVALALAAGLTGFAPNVAAQTATPLDRFDPSPAGDPLLGVPEPHVRGELRPSAGALITFSRSPLVVVRDGEEVGDVVSHQLYLHGLISLHLFNRVALDVDVPGVLNQSGVNPLIGSQPSPSPSGAAMGDIRAGARVEILRRHGYWPAAALAMNVWFPSGDDEAFASSGYVRYAPSLIVGLSDEAFVYSARVGRRFDPSPDNLVGDELFFGAGGGPKFGDLLLTAELLGATSLGGEVDAFRRNTTHLEAHLGARYQIGPVRVQLSGGPGLTTAPGTPDWRLGFFVGYVPGAEPVEGGVTHRARRPDGDDDDDSTPAPRPTTSSPHAPPPPSDLDGDGVPDTSDACPRVVGASTGPRPGCPPDGDGDGVIDARDACPDTAGVPSDDPKRNGCPGDRDGDGIVDTEDACPEERGAATDDPKTTGCPKTVRVVGEQIVILQKVEFATGRATLAESNAALLTEVAQVLADHPEIVRVAIEGHTDDVGSERRNIALSQQRALAVMRWLIDHGVDERRLEARGYGPRRPLVPNRTDDDRAKNRRVDFQILRRDPRRRDAWVDGAVNEEKR